MASFSGPGSLVELASKDRFGDRIHLWLACGTLACLPLNGEIAAVSLIALLIWGLIRTVCWRAYLPTGPRVVMIPALVWVGYLTLSLAWSPDFRTGWHQVWAQTWLVLPPLLWPLVNRWRVLVLSVLVGTLLQATFHSSVILIDGYRVDGWGFAGFDEHPRRIAVWYAAVTVGLVTAWFARIVSNPWWLVGIIPTAGACILSESRGALLAILAGMATSFLLLSKRGLLTRRKTLLVVLISLALGSTFLFSNHQTLREVRESVITLSESVTEGRVDNIRIAWWKSCVRQWMNRPVLGYGIGGTEEAMATDLKLTEDAEDFHHEYPVVFNQPHSVYFQTLLEGGIVGVMLLGWLLGTIAFLAYRTSRNHPLGTLAMGGLVVWIVTGAFDQWQSQGQTLGLLWLAGTLAAFDPTWLQENSPATSPSRES